MHITAEFDKLALLKDSIEQAQDSAIAAGDLLALALYIERLLGVSMQEARAISQCRTLTIAPTPTGFVAVIADQPTIPR